MITSSIAGRRALKGSLYSATKFAVTGMAEAARQDFNGTGVRTTLISPGMVETPGFSHDLQETLTADDIARAVLFAVSQPLHMDVNEILIRPTAQDSAEDHPFGRWRAAASPIASPLCSTRCSRPHGPHVRTRRPRRR